MSILIKGMEKPKDCRECKMLTYYSTSGCSMCDITGNALARNFKPIPFDGIPDWCPIIEIPEPHGDLIDRDALRIAELDTLIMIRYKLAYAPTVIEAEWSED